MGSNHFASLSRRPGTRQTYKRPALSRNEPLPVEAHSRHYSLNDSSDDEIPLPMKFSAITRALLNDEASLVGHSPPTTARTTPEPPASDGAHARAGSASTVDASAKDRVSPPGTRISSPFPRRVVRLSSTPGSSTMRRTSSLSSAVKKHNEQQIAVPTEESALDLNTPAPVPRTVRIPITSSVNHRLSTGSSGKYSSRVGSASRSEDENKQAEPATVAKPYLATSHGSVSRYGASTIGRTGYGEEIGLQSSMRVKRIEGAFMRGPARRGRRRQDADEQSPMEERGDGVNSAPSSQESQSQGSQESQEPQRQEQGSSQESEANHASLYGPSYRDFASGIASGSPMSSKDVVNSVLRSKSPPPPTLSSSQKSASATSLSIAPKQTQPVFKVPAPKPDLPSNHDQENEAPPTFRRNKQAPLIHLDKLEKVPVRPESLDLSVMRSAISPERRALAPRSQNTPRRPAPPPPRMSVLEAATAAAGAATTSNANGRRNRVKVNGTSYTRLGVIGRGGSGKVYRVMADSSKMFALKRVSLENADEAAVRGFKGEIDLLKKLDSVERVIRLWDYEMNDEKGVLTMVSLAFHPNSAPDAN